MKMNAQPSTVARRSVLAAGAMGTVGVVAAACGDDSGGSSDSAGSATTAPSSAPPASTGSGSGAAALGTTSEIPVGGGKIFTAEKVVVTQPTAGDFKCFSAVCTHQGCLVSQVQNSEIVCTCHQSRFSAADGSVLGGPATSPLPAETINVSGTEITLG